MASRFNSIRTGCIRISLRLTAPATTRSSGWSRRDRIADHRTAAGAGWVVLADPEGNEFWVERGDAERGPAEPKRYRIGAD
jgi:hypothetical protein